MLLWYGATYIHFKKKYLSHYLYKMLLPIEWQGFKRIFWNFDIFISCKPQASLHKKQKWESLKLYWDVIAALRATKVELVFARCLEPRSTK